MFITVEQIYVWAGLLILGLGDLYLYRFPLFHPIVLLPVAGWIWGDLGNGLVVGGMLELIFGLAQLKENRKLTLILYAGGLAIFTNLTTYNISLALSITVGLILALGVQSALAKAREWQKWVLLLIISGLIALIWPLGKEAYGLIPAQLLNHMAVAEGVLPWIFFAYALVGLIGRNRERIVELAIPAVSAGSVLCLYNYIWGPVVFVILIYLLDVLLKDRDWHFLWWVNLAILVLAGYLLLPALVPATLWIFGGLLIFNILLVARGFVPFEIYLLNFIVGIILSRGGLLG